MTRCASLLPEAKVIDLHDRCVIPGLIDAHLHAEWTALGLKNIDAETPTLDELLRRVDERAKITPKGDWIRGHGWNQNVWGGQFPTRADLDRVAPEHPVYLTAKSGHAGWANSLALKMAGHHGEHAKPDRRRDRARRGGGGRTDRHLLRRRDGVGQQVHS